jgi:hypothetical protein
MKAHLFDNTTAQPGEKHGPLGPTHYGTITVDYAYQVEQWVIDLEEAEPQVVRIECPDLGRKWLRNDLGKFEEPLPGVEESRA